MTGLLFGRDQQAHAAARGAVRDAPPPTLPAPLESPFAELEPRIVAHSTQIAHPRPALRCVGLLLLALAATPASPAPAAAAPGAGPVAADIWERSDPQYARYAASADSPLVRRLLELPVTETLEQAETARVALFLLGRDREATLLQRYMENDVIAGILSLPWTRADTVRAAVAREAAGLDPDYRLRLPAAVGAARGQGAAVSQTGAAFVARRHALVATDSIRFGYPANGPDAPRQRAHVLVTTSSCRDRRNCRPLDAREFINAHRIPARLLVVGLAVTYGLLAGAAFVLLVRRRTASAAARRIARFAVLPAAVHLALVAMQIFSLDVTPGEGAAAGVAIVPALQFLFASLLLVASIALVAVCVRGARPAD